MMEYAIWAFAAVVLLLAAIAGAGRFGEMPDAVPDHFVPRLPERPLRPGDLRNARFALTLRGYSPAQVDHLIGRAWRSWQAEQDAAAKAPSMTAWLPDPSSPR